MNIIVILKEVFDTEEKIAIENGKIVNENTQSIINPYDEYAIEEAIKLREEFGGEVTLISVGASQVESTLRTALAMGADKAILVDKENLTGDEYTTSKVLATVIKERSFDIILGGNMSIDNGAGQTAPRLAEELGIVHVGSITSLSVEDGQARIVRDVEGDLEIIEASLPILVTAQQGLNEPRYPSLPGIMKAKKKPIEKVTLENLGLDIEAIQAKTVIVDQYLPPEKKAGHILTGELKEQVQELVHLLQHETKVI